jgi:predicted anti-sigma-YlaC factor YlaD
MTSPCPFEDGLLDALARGFVGAELETHLTACQACRELRLVAGALLDDRVHAAAEAALPSAGAMWWRLQVRRRHDAATAARRSLVFGQAATLLVALALLLAFFGGGVTGELRHLVSTVSTIRISTPILVVAATWLLAAPIAGWVAIRQK